MINRYIKPLTQLAHNYSKAEEAIVAAFFHRRPSKQDHARWLRAQAFKEYSAIRPILATLVHLYSEIDRNIDRHSFEDLTEKLADETRHACLVMELLEKVEGRCVTAEDLVWLPEDRKLAAIRARYSKSFATLLHGSGSIRAKDIKRTDEALERAAITLTEGGGGALYKVCRTLKNTRFEKAIARVFSRIFDDEVNHKEYGERSLTAAVRTKEQFCRTAHIIAEISLQRLRMRNEQFGFPVADETIRVYDREIRQVSSAFPEVRSVQGNGNKMHDRRLSK
jgi:hypothetical protein